MRPPRIYPFERIVRRTLFLLETLPSTLKDALKRSRTGCFIGFHDWMRWRMKYPKLNIQHRRCRVCRRVQIRDKDLAGRYL